MQVLRQVQIGKNTFTTYSFKKYLLETYKQDRQGPCFHETSILVGEEGKNRPETNKSQSVVTQIKKEVGHHLVENWGCADYRCGLWSEKGLRSSPGHITYCLTLDKALNLSVLNVSVIWGK